MAMSCPSLEPNVGGPNAYMVSMCLENIGEEKRAPMSNAERARNYRQRHKEELSVRTRNYADLNFTSQDSVISLAAAASELLATPSGHRTAMTSAERSRRHRERLREARLKAQLHDEVSSTSSTAHQSTASDEFEDQLGKRSPLSNTERSRRYRQRQKEAQLNLKIVQLCGSKTRSHDGGPASSSAPIIFFPDADGKLLWKRPPMTNAERGRRYRQRQKEAQPNLLTSRVEHPEVNVPTTSSDTAALNGAEEIPEARQPLTSADLIRKFRQEQEESRLNQDVQQIRTIIPSVVETTSSAPVEMDTLNVCEGPLEKQAVLTGAESVRNFRQRQEEPQLSIQSIHQSEASSQSYGDESSTSSIALRFPALDELGKPLEKRTPMTSSERSRNYRETLEETLLNVQYVEPLGGSIPVHDTALRNVVAQPQLLSVRGVDQEACKKTTPLTSEGNAGLSPQTQIQTPVDVQNPQRPEAGCQFFSSGPSKSSAVALTVALDGLEGHSREPSALTSTAGSRKFSEEKREAPSNVPNLRETTVKIEVLDEVPSTVPNKYQSPVFGALLPKRRALTGTERTRLHRQRKKEAQMQARNLQDLYAEFRSRINVRPASFAGTAGTLNHAGGQRHLLLHNVQQREANMRIGNGGLSTAPTEPLEFVLGESEGSSQRPIPPPNVTGIPAPSASGKRFGPPIALSDFGRMAKIPRRQEEVRLSTQNVQESEPRIRLIPKTLVVEVPMMSSVLRKIPARKISVQLPADQTPSSSAEQTKSSRERQRAAQLSVLNVQQYEACSQSYPLDSSAAPPKPLLLVSNASEEPTKKKVAMTSLERARKYRLRQKEAKLALLNAQQSEESRQVLNDVASASDSTNEISAPVEEKRTPMTTSERSRKFRRKLREAQSKSRCVKCVGCAGTNSASNDDLPSTSSDANQSSAHADCEDCPKQRTPMTNTERSRNYRRRLRAAQLIAQCGQQLEASSSLYDNVLLIPPVPNRSGALDGFEEHSGKRAPLTSAERARNYRLRQREARLYAPSLQEFGVDVSSPPDLQSTDSAEHQVCAFDDFEDPPEKQIPPSNSDTPSESQRRQREA